MAVVLSTALVMLSLNSCNDPLTDPADPEDPEEPATANFPALVENYEVLPGSTLTLTFTPNYKWELTVPSETYKYFWLFDDSFKVDKLSGEASDSPVTVKIGVSDEEEFDNNRSCDVTMTMNGESKVIAKYMRPAKNRTLAVYSAEVDSDGSLLLGEDGESYVYGTEEFTSASLVWNAIDGDFRLPVRVDANCEWDINVPEWLTVEKPEKTTGVVELIFTGISLEGASGEVEFKSGEEVLKKFAVTIPSCKGVEAYTAKMSEGEFEYGEDGYVWSEESVSEFSLAWLGSDFRMPVRISAKCNWTIKTPDWLEAELPEKTVGEIDLVFKGVPSKYPLEDTKGKVQFIFDDVVLHELIVNIPGCKDIMTYGIDMSLTSLEYNAEGWIKTTTGYEDMDVAANIYGSKDVKVFAVETTGGVVGSNPDWFVVNMSKYDMSGTADVLQEREITFEVEKNEGYAERSAVVFFLSPSMSDDLEDLFNSDATVNEAYVKYAVPVYQFSSVYADYMEVSMAEDRTEYTFNKLSGADSDALTEIFGETDHVYSLVYEVEYSKVWMNLAVAYDSYKVYSGDYVDMSSKEDFWLQFTGNETYTFGAFKMYDGQELPETASTGYVVFKDAERKVLAIVKCVSPYRVEDDEIITPPVGDDEDYITDEGGNKYFVNNSYFADPEAAALAGAKMYQYVAGPIYDNSREEISNGAVILKLVLPGPDIPVDIDVKDSYTYYQMPFALAPYITVNDEAYSESQGLTAEKTSAKISMTAIPDTAKDTPMVKFHTSMAVSNPFLAIYLFLE